MDVTCLKCNISNEYYIVEKTTNKSAYCNKCNSYIKNISYDVPKLYVGRYKGIPITDIDDVEYLKWALKSLKLTVIVKESLKSKISKLEYLAK